MLRIKLKYTRRKVVEEEGYVTVDVPSDATVAEAYRAAYERKWTEKLAQNENVVDDDWDFSMFREKQNEKAT